MSKLSTLASMTATIAVCACLAHPALPSQATLALYDANAPRADAMASPSARHATGGTSSAMTPIGDFVRSRSAQLQFCYQETRTANPSLAGSVTIGVLLAPDGTVTRADVLRRTWEGRGVAEAESCALTKVRSWKFPPTDGPATRPYSFSAVFTR